MFSLFRKKQTVITDEDRIQEVLTRGVEEVIHKESLEKKMRSGRRLRIKLGIDPTSPNLHLGRATQLLKLRDFQKLGHHIVLIIGDGTGVVGDTSDKDSERPMLTRSVVEENMKTYFAQAGMILDMSQVETRRNSEWLHKLGYEEIGEHADQFSVADFIARDNIKRRLDAGKRVSLREVLYPLMQGYDSVATQADVELGGTDQRFNLLAGRVLQEHFGQEPQDIILSPLIAGTDGRKMSSSWGNTVNLTDSPDDMYAKIMKTRDDVMRLYFTNLTRMPLNEIENILTTEHPRDAKMRLAYEIVALLHDEHTAQRAQDAFVRVFQKQQVPADAKKVPADDGETLCDVCIREGVVASKTEWKRLVGDGAVTNKTSGEKIVDTEARAERGVYKIGKHRFIEIV